MGVFVAKALRLVRIAAPHHHLADGAPRWHGPASASVPVYPVCQSPLGFRRPREKARGNWPVPRWQPFARRVSSLPSKNSGSTLTMGRHQYYRILNSDHGSELADCLLQRDNVHRINSGSAAITRISTFIQAISSRTAGLYTDSGTGSAAWACHPVVPDALYFSFASEVKPLSATQIELCPLDKSSTLCPAVACFCPAGGPSYPSICVSVVWLSQAGLAIAGPNLFLPGGPPRDLCFL